MNQMLAIFQLIASFLCAVIAIATVINLGFISTRPETISVVNTMIGQGVLIIGFFALARILFVKGRKRLAQRDTAT